MKEPKLTTECTKLFHQFKFKDRNIVLCILKIDTYNAKVGISVCNPKDDFDLKLGKKIAEYRAKHKRNISIRTIYISNSYGSAGLHHTYGLYKYLLKETEEIVKLNPNKYIKSIK